MKHLHTYIVYVQQGLCVSHCQIYKIGCSVVVAQRTETFISCTFTNKDNTETSRRKWGLLTASEKVWRVYTLQPIQKAPFLTCPTLDNINKFTFCFYRTIRVYDKFKQNVTCLFTMTIKLQTDFKIVTRSSSHSLQVTTEH